MYEVLVDNQLEQCFESNPDGLNRAELCFDRLTEPVHGTSGRVELRKGATLIRLEGKLCSNCIRLGYPRNECLARDVFRKK